MHVRPARRDDYAAFTRFWDELVFDQEPPNLAHWDEHMRPSTIFIDVDGEPIAYALIFPLGARGDVRQIAVAPAWRGRGIGGALMTEVLTRLRAAGCKDWRLEVREDNTAAVALYRRAGMDVLHTIEAQRIPSDAAERFAATRSRTLSIEAVAPDDDAALEARFDFGSGAIERWRRIRPHGVMMQIDGVAFAHYTKDFAAYALMFPLRAATTDQAAHFFAEACRIGLRPETDTMLFDPPIAEALRSAGARITMRLLIMGGAL
jgi:ribosomal protein S18 acetylase RimI-like enzyme